MLAVLETSTANLDATSANRVEAACGAVIVTVEEARAATGAELVDRYMTCGP